VGCVLQYKEGGQEEGHHRYAGPPGPRSNIKYTLLCIFMLHGFGSLASPVLLEGVSKSNLFKNFCSFLGNYS